VTGSPPIGVNRDAPVAVIQPVRVANQKDCVPARKGGHPIVRCTFPYRGNCTYVRYGQLSSTVHIVRITYVRTLVQTPLFSLAGTEPPAHWLAASRFGGITGCRHATGLPVIARRRDHGQRRMTLNSARLNGRVRPGADTGAGSLAGGVLTLLQNFDQLGNRHSRNRKPTLP
jgi:hypothetical protein